MSEVTTAPAASEPAPLAMPPAIRKTHQSPRTAGDAVMWSIKVAGDLDIFMREYARANGISLAYAAAIAFRTLQANVESDVAAKTVAEEAAARKAKKTGAPKFAGNAEERSEVAL